jgi:hypothetical protein
MVMTSLAGLLEKLLNNHTAIVIMQKSMSPTDEPLAHSYSFSNMISVDIGCHYKKPTLSEYTITSGQNTIKAVYPDSISGQDYLAFLSIFRKKNIVPRHVHNFLQTIKDKKERKNNIQIIKDEIAKTLKAYKTRTGRKEDLIKHVFYKYILDMAIRSRDDPPIVDQFPRNKVYSAFYLNNDYKPFYQWWFEEYNRVENPLLQVTFHGLERDFKAYTKTPCVDQNGAPITFFGKIPGRRSICALQAGTLLKIITQYNRDTCMTLTTRQWDALYFIITSIDSKGKLATLDQYQKYVENHGQWDTSTDNEKIYEQMRTLTKEHLGARSS